MAVDVRYASTRCLQHQELACPVCYGLPQRDPGDETPEKRETFTVPEGMEAVRDSKGRATGALKRTFATGAMRDTDEGKYDYEGFLHPDFLKTFAAYMAENQTMADGTRRESDNWQKGMPLADYVKSAWRHFLSWWRLWRGLPDAEGELGAIGGVIFNAQGFIVERMKADPDWFPRELAKYQAYRANELEKRRAKQ